MGFFIRDQTGLLCFLFFQINFWVIKKNMYVLTSESGKPPKKMVHLYHRSTCHMLGWQAQYGQQVRQCYGLVYCRRQPNRPERYRSGHFGKKSQQEVVVRAMRVCAAISYRPFRRALISTAHHARSFSGLSQASVKRNGNQNAQQNINLCITNMSYTSC